MITSLRPTSEKLETRTNISVPLVNHIELGTISFMNLYKLFIDRVKWLTNSNSSPESIVVKSFKIVNYKNVTQRINQSFITAGKHWCPPPPTTPYHCTV